MTDSAPWDMKSLMIVSRMPSMPFPETTMLFTGKPVYPDIACLSSSASKGGYRLTLPALSLMADTARGGGSSGFSLEPSLMILSGSRLYFSAISSIDFPGTYSFICFTVGRRSFSNLIQHRHRLIKLLFRDGKWRDKAEN